MAGRYVVEGRLGRGGMGIVDLAVAPDGTRVALKRIALHGSAEAMGTAKARIRREAEVLARLHHDGVVGLLDVVDDGDDVVLVMPWMQGGNLADRLGAGAGPLPPAEVERIADFVLDALAAAHRAGIVHRDVKPANVLFDDAGRPHLADFGVATARDVTAGLTMVGGTIGTPGFVAPEQARGEPAGPAADVFSLGATLRWAVTGVGPYGVGPADVLLWRAAKGKVDRCPRSVPQPLRGRIDAMLDVRADRRPTAAALVGGPAGTIVRPTAARADRSRRPRVWPVLAMAVAAVIAVAAAFALSREPGRGAVGAPPSSTTATTPTTAACVPLPYQPCGAAVPAPGTDGRACIDERADYDGDAVNGCEAVPDGLDGTVLESSLEATIAPADDVDEFVVHVRDGFQVFCDGTLRLQLTAPAGMTLRVELVDDDGRVVGQQTSADGVPGRLDVREPDCFDDDSTTLTARVTPIGSDRTAAPYTLTRTGSF